MGSNTAAAWLSRWVSTPMTCSTLPSCMGIGGCPPPRVAAVVGTGLGGDTARQDCEGSRPRSDRLLIKPAAMVTRPVPAA
jgi:hypothetical protein